MKPETWTLQSVSDGKVDPDGTNPPSNPTLISPQKTVAELAVGGGAGGGDTVTVPAYSYVVVEYGGAASQ